MTKKKNYLDNEDLKEEILKCINEGYKKALSFGFVPNDPFYDNTDLFPIKKRKTDKKEVDLLKIYTPDHPDYDKVVELGFDPDRTNWIKKIRNFKPDVVNEMVKCGDLTKEKAEVLLKQMEKPTASEKLGRMFNLIVENVSKTFYWENPDDGLDCKANALFDLCSGFWKFEPVDAKSKPYNAFAFCTQIAYFGIAGAHRYLHPKKYDGTISMSCIDENGKSFDMYNI